MSMRASSRLFDTAHEQAGKRDEQVINIQVLMAVYCSRAVPQDEGGILSADARGGGRRSQGAGQNGDQQGACREERDLPRARHQVGEFQLCADQGPEGDDRQSGDNHAANGADRADHG